MNMILSLKIEKGFFYFLMAIFGMVFFIAAPGVINYLQLHWQVLSPIVCLNFMLIGFFLTIYFSNKKAPEDIDKQKITPYDYIEVHKRELLELLWHIYDEQIEDIKTLYNDSVKITREIGSFFVNFTKMLRNDSLILKDERSCRIQEEEVREKRISLTNEYIRRFMEAKGSSSQDIQIVCAVSETYIETGLLLMDKNLHISYNEKLRNGELYQFAVNIKNFNKKDDLDIEAYLLTIFSEWFKGKNKKNIAKNYGKKSALPKDSLATREGLMADLERLRKGVVK